MLGMPPKGIGILPLSLSLNSNVNLHGQFHVKIGGGRLIPPLRLVFFSFGKEEVLRLNSTSFKFLHVRSPTYLLY
jgi:hypothetical protein